MTPPQRTGSPRDVAYRVGETHEAVVWRDDDITLLEGTPLSEGAGHGQAWFVKTSPPRRKGRRRIAEERIPEEKGKLRHAIQIVSFAIDNALSQVKARGEDDAARIFDMLKQIVHDPHVLNRMMELIRKDRLSAAAAVRTAFSEQRKALAGSSLALIRERSGDLAELEQSLLDALVNPHSLRFGNKDRGSSSGRGGIVAVAARLTPRLVLELRDAGVVTGYAAVTSHAAILCRTFGIPAVSAVEGFPEGGDSDYSVAVNGSAGLVAVSPKRKKTAELARRIRSVYTRDAPSVHIPADSRPSINANINLAEQATQAIAAGAEGIGLYRTELEFLAAGKLLNAGRQARKYRGLVMTMMGLPTTIRLLDASREKLGPIVDTSSRRIDLSRRGAGFLLDNPAVLRTQARAIAEAAEVGPVSVLYPLVEDEDQFGRLKDFFCRSHGAARGRAVRHGVMVETVGAAARARELLSIADFAAIGTNDLLDEVAGTNREDSAGREPSPKHLTELWGMVESIAESARSCTTPLTVCGEMAAAPESIARFVSLGIGALSVDVGHLRRVRALVAGHGRPGTQSPLHTTD